MDKLGPLRGWAFFVSGIWLPDHGQGVTMKTLLSWLVRFGLRVLMDKALRSAVYQAVEVAEATGLKGEEKMQQALEYVKSVGGQAVLRETESTLRTKIEQAIDDLKLSSKGAL